MMIHNNYIEGASWFLKPSGCNPDFWVAQGAIPPAFQAAYPDKTSIADGNTGANWWTDGEAGWRLFYARTGNKSKKRFGLCPSYFGHDSDINCISFAPDKENDDWYWLPRETFTAMDLGYNTADYAQYNISNAEPFVTTIDRDSMLDAFDDWADLSWSVNQLVLADSTKIVWQLTLPFFVMSVAACLGNAVTTDKEKQDALIIFLGCTGIMLALWLPGGMATRIWTQTADQEIFSDPVNWQGMFPYCSEIEVTSFMDHKRHEGKEDGEDAGFYTMGLNIWGVSVWYLVLASLFSLPGLPLWLMSLATFLGSFPGLDKASEAIFGKLPKYSKGSYEALFERLQKEAKEYNDRAQSFSSTSKATPLEKQEYKGCLLSDNVKKHPIRMVKIPHAPDVFSLSVLADSPVAKTVFSEGYMSIFQKAKDQKEKGLKPNLDDKDYWVWQIRRGDLVQRVIPYHSNYNETSGTVSGSKWFFEDITEGEGVMAFGRVLDVQDGSMSFGSVEGEGIAPKRVVVVQWLDFPSSADEENPAVKMGLKEYEVPIFRPEGFLAPWMDLMRVPSSEDIKRSEEHLANLDEARKDASTQDQAKLKAALEFLREECWLIETAAFKKAQDPKQPDTAISATIDTIPDGKI